MRLADSLTRLRRPAGAIALLAAVVAWALLALPVEPPPPEACPAAGEGLNQCVLQKAYAPAIVTLAALLAGGWLLADALTGRLPLALHRRARGERFTRRPLGQGRELIEADPVLAAATWGVLPDPSRRLRREQRRAARSAAPVPDVARAEAPAPSAPAPSAPAASAPAPSLEERCERLLRDHELPMRLLVTLLSRLPDDAVDPPADAPVAPAEDASAAEEPTAFERLLARADAERRERSAPADPYLVAASWGGGARPT